jgi:hypothetical protein
MAATAYGGFMWHGEVLRHHIDWFWRAPLIFAASATHYTRFALHGGVSAKELLADLPPLALLLAILFAPGGVLVYWRDRLVVRGRP